MITKYTQYKNDLFNKLNFKFKKKKKILDLGCGNGLDAKILQKEYALDVFCVDIYKDDNLQSLELRFKLGSIYKIPYKDNYFDYVFLHDVLHHIDEKKQSKISHKKGLQEVWRVCKKGGVIIFIEGNRYNPLFYPHMVRIKKHNHWSQFYFKGLINQVYNKDIINFRFIEAHAYPKKYIKLFKIYEYIMEHFMPASIRAYNIAFITKQ